MRERDRKLLQRFATYVGWIDEGSVINRAIEAVLDEDAQDQDGPQLQERQGVADESSSGRREPWTNDRPV